MSDTTALKPCPFCGFDPELHRVAVECHSPVCSVQPMASGPDQETAISRWNRRAALAAAQQPAEPLSEARMREVLLAAAAEIAAELGADVDGEIDEDVLAMVTRYCRAVEREVRAAAAASAAVEIPSYQQHGQVPTGQPAALQDRIADLQALGLDMLAALREARGFIVNGVALGFIRLPDATTPDPAHQTLPMIEAAIARATGESK